MGKGVGSGVPETFLFRNVRTSPFTEFEIVTAGFGGAWIGKLGLADLDEDGDLDLMQIGVERSGQPITRLYQNMLGGSFSNPATPGQLSEMVTASSATLNWQGPGGATTFNVRIGTTPGGVDIVTPMADVGTGRRRLAALGNAGSRQSFSVQKLRPGRYYWSVQSIDAAFNVSAFALERDFTVGGTPERPRLSARISQSSLMLKVTGTTGQVMIQTSRDLQSWQDAVSSVSPNQEITLDLSSEPRVFFRARVLP